MEALIKAAFEVLKADVWQDIACHLRTARPAGFA